MSFKIVIKDFAKKYFALENPIIESETFCNNEFSIFLVKEKNMFQKNTGFVSLCLKCCPNEQNEKFSFFWRISILLLNKKPFVTLGKNFNFVIFNILIIVMFVILKEGNDNNNLENFAVGSEKFISEKNLFDYKNDLLLNDCLNLHVEVMFLRQE